MVLLRHKISCFSVGHTVSSSEMSVSDCGDSLEQQGASPAARWPLHIAPSVPVALGRCLVPPVTSILVAAVPWMRDPFPEQNSSTFQHHDFL